MSANGFAAETASGQHRMVAEDPLDRFVEYQAESTELATPNHGQTEAVTNPGAIHETSRLVAHITDGLVNLASGSSASPAVGA